jgi:hypothetical protein
MSKSLTFASLRGKKIISITTHESILSVRLMRFPSYFHHFSLFHPFLPLPRKQPSSRRRFTRKREIPPTAANMAIV